MLNSSSTTRFGEQSNGQPLVNTQGTIIPNFSATDTDGGLYGEVTFSLQGRDGKLSFRRKLMVEAPGQMLAKLIYYVGAFFGNFFSYDTENAQDHTYFQLIRVDRNHVRLVVPNVDAIEVRSYQVREAFFENWNLHEKS